MKIAEALSRAAKQSGMSDVEIAAAIGVSQGTVTDWRKDKKRPRSQHLIKLIEIVPGFGKLVGLVAAGSRLAS